MQGLNAEAPNPRACADLTVPGCCIFCDYKGPNTETGEGTESHCSLMALGLNKGSENFRTCGFSLCSNQRPLSAAGISVE